MWIATYPAQHWIHRRWTRLPRCRRRWSDRDQGQQPSPDRPCSGPLLSWHRIWSDTSWAASQQRGPSSDSHLSQRDYTNLRPTGIAVSRWTEPGLAVWFLILWPSCSKKEPRETMHVYLYRLDVTQPSAVKHWSELKALTTATNKSQLQLTVW